MERVGVLDVLVPPLNEASINPDRIDASLAGRQDGIEPVTRPHLVDRDAVERSEVATERFEIGISLVGRLEVAEPAGLKEDVWREKDRDVVAVLLGDFHRFAELGTVLVVGEHDRPQRPPEP